MLNLFLILFFIFGTLIGSFLNVIIFRLNTGKGIGGRSMCMNCGKTLHSHELVPILSYIFQLGKCRGCKAKVSIQYPIVEALTGFVSGVLAAKIGVLNILTDQMSPLYFLAAFSFFSIFIAIAVYDFRHKIIPPSLSNLATIVAFLVLVLGFSSNTIVLKAFLDSFYGGLIGFLPFAGLYFISNGKWMGFGDARVGLAGGIILGKITMLMALMYSFWIGAIITLFVLLIRGKKITMNTEIPFGPYLTLGIFIAFVLSGTNLDLAKVLFLNY
ncbi:MAG: prepilin peptidase [Candidatus Pacebacteria bacterium]|nr:prepilin peptidase [Candidatus Paceibacterota bacterium]